MLSPGQANHATAKAGIIGFTKTAATELARFGITVNAISPNAETRMIAGVPDEKRAELIAGIPMGRFAAPDEMYGAIALLASEEAGYITGTVLPVDGGLSGEARLIGGLQRELHPPILAIIADRFGEPETGPHRAADRVRVTLPACQRTGQRDHRVRGRAELPLPAGKSNQPRAGPDNSRFRR